MDGESDLEILKKIVQREKYSIIISLLLDLLSFPPKEVEEVKRCLRALNDLVDHINNYTEKDKSESEIGDDLLVKYCNELYNNEEEILKNERTNREISSLKNEMETDMYCLLFFIQ